MPDPTPNVTCDGEPVVKGLVVFYRDFDHAVQVLDPQPDANGCILVGTVGGVPLGYASGCDMLAKSSVEMTAAKWVTTLNYTELAAMDDELRR
jgi:hypothetical protein